MSTALSMIESRVRINLTYDKKKTTVSRNPGTRAALLLSLFSSHAPALLRARLSSEFVTFHCGRCVSPVYYFKDVTY